MYLSEKQVKKNVLGQGVKILHSLIEHYESGNIEDDRVNGVFMGLLALVCEGAVKGSYSDDGRVVWTLAEKIEEKADEGNIIPFPLTKR